MMIARKDIIGMARKAGIAQHGLGFTCWEGQLERFAELVAAAERIKHQSEIQRLTTLANSAEKWRGIALARDGDGRTVQQVQEEARAEEREECAGICDRFAARDMNPAECAAAIRARK